MEKIILTGDVICDKEDGGRALIAEVGSMESGILHDDEDDYDAFFVRLQSWDDRREHTIMKSLEGKKVRVTIEIID
jgi:hypothetical protein